MKKFVLLLIVIVITFTTTSCTRRPILRLLNWGDYLDDELIYAFEDKYNVLVKQIYFSSNEDMYAQLRNGMIQYDIAVPSDYMIEKLYLEDNLHKIDFSKLTNYSEGMFDDLLEEKCANYFEEGNVLDYSIPYFWGTFGIMYSNRNPGNEEAIKKYGYEVFFNNEIVPKDVHIGMYNSARYAAAISELYLGMSLNTTNDEDLNKVGDLLKQQKQDFENIIWGDDNLKTGIAAKNIDYGFVYAGDFFDQISILSESGISTDGLGFYVPETTNLFFDALVIPKTSSNVDLAHKFIDFMLDKEVALQNVDFVGYCPPITEVFEELKKPDYQDGYWLDLMTKYDFYPGKETINGEMFNDLGKDIYIKLEKIVNEAKI